MLVDDENYPWVLEANMSPGIAKRNDHQNLIVENMSSGMLKIILSHAGEDISSLPCFNDKFGNWEELISDVENNRTELPPKEAYLDNRNAVLGKSIDPHSILNIDARFMRSEKQILLQR